MGGTYTPPTWRTVLASGLFPVYRPVLPHEPEWSGVRMQMRVARFVRVPRYRTAASLLLGRARWHLAHWIVFDVAGERLPCHVCGHTPVRWRVAVMLEKALDWRRRRRERKRVVALSDVLWDEFHL